MLMGVAKEYGAQHHGQCSESGDAGRDVGFFVEGKTQFDEMQHAVPVQREFNHPQETLSHRTHGRCHFEPQIRLRLTSLCHDGQPVSVPVVSGHEHDEVDEPP